MVTTKARGLIVQGHKGCVEAHPYALSARMNLPIGGAQNVYRGETHFVYWMTDPHTQSFNRSHAKPQILYHLHYTFCIGIFP